MALERTYEKALNQLRPKGKIWETPDPETPIEAEELAKIHNLFDLIVKESDVRQAYYLIDEWGDVYKVDTKGKILQKARFDLSLKKNAKGGATPAYFIQLAKSFGFEAEITECLPFTCGLSECGGEDECGDEDVAYVWFIELKGSDVIAFRTGESECGDALGEELSDFETFLQILRNQKPAHTRLYIKM